MYLIHIWIGVSRVIFIFLFTRRITLFSRLHPHICPVPFVRRARGMACLSNATSGMQKSASYETRQFLLYRAKYVFSNNFVDRRSTGHRISFRTLLTRLAFQLFARPMEMLKREESIYRASNVASAQSFDIKQYLDLVIPR